MLANNRQPTRNVPGRWLGLAALAGAIAWAVKALYLAIVAVTNGQDFWLPANLAGATFSAFDPPAVGFVAGATLTGLALHILTGAISGLIFGMAVFYGAPRLLRSYGRMALAGLVFGLAYHLVAQAIGPLFNADMVALNTVLGWGNVFVSNLIYGVLTGLLLKAMIPQSRLTVSMAPETVRETTYR